MWFKKRQVGVQLCSDNLVLAFIEVCQAQICGGACSSCRCILKQVVTCNMQYFRISGFVYIIRQKCRLLNKLSISDASA